MINADKDKVNVIMVNKFVQAIMAYKVTVKVIKAIVEACYQGQSHGHDAHDQCH